jgi:hypothetical protein
VVCGGVRWFAVVCRDACSCGCVFSCRWLGGHGCISVCVCRVCVCRVCVCRVCVCRVCVRRLCVYAVHVV